MDDENRCTDCGEVLTQDDADFLNSQNENYDFEVSDLHYCEACWNIDDGEAPF